MNIKVLVLGVLVIGLGAAAYFLLIRKKKTSTEGTSLVAGAVGTLSPRDKWIWDYLHIEEHPNMLPTWHWFNGQDLTPQEQAEVSWADKERGNTQEYQDYMAKNYWTKEEQVYHNS